MKKYYQPELVNEHVPKEPIPEEVRIQYLRPGQMLSIQEKFPVVYQPLGTIEWHGRHNPLGCDAIKAENLCIESAKKTGGVVMPPLYFGADAYWDVGKGYGLGMDPIAGFQLPGSFYQIKTELLKNFMINACQNYLNRGFKMVAIVSGHNSATQQEIMDEVCYEMKTDEGKEPVFFVMEYKTIEEGNPRRSGDHAGGYETSMMMHLAGDRVNLKTNEGQKIPQLAMSNAIPFEEASAEEGKIRFELQVEGFSKLVKEKYKSLIK